MSDSHVLLGSYSSAGHQIMVITSHRKEDAGLSDDLWIIIMEQIFQDEPAALLLFSRSSRRFNHLAMPLICRTVTFPEASRMVAFDMHVQRNLENLAKYTRVLEFPFRMDHSISTSTVSYLVTKCVKLQQFRWNNVGPFLPPSLFEYILLRFPEIRFHYKKADSDYPEETAKELLSLPFPLDKIHSLDVAILHVRNEDELKEFVQALVRCVRLQWLFLDVEEHNYRRNNPVPEDTWKDVTMMKSLTIRHPDPLDLCPLSSFRFFGSTLTELDLLTRGTKLAFFGNSWRYLRSSITSHDDLESIFTSCNHLKKLHVFVCLDTPHRDNMINLLSRWKSLQDIRFESFGHLHYHKSYSEFLYHHVSFNIAKSFIASVVANSQSLLRSMLIITRHQPDRWTGYDFRKYEYKDAMFGYHTYNVSVNRKVEVCFKYRLDQKDPIEDDVNETLITTPPIIQTVRGSAGCVKQWDIGAN